jgi:predicted dehydrogenase
MINLGFVGLGWWGNELAIAASQLSADISISGCHSLSESEMENFSAKFKARTYKSYQEILSDPDINGVVLSTPHSLHGEQIIQAANAGKHVFVEKPLALSIEDATSAATCCKDNGLVLAVGHNRRFSAVAQELAKWIKSEKFGQILHVEAHFSSNSAMKFEPDNWRANRKESPAGSLVSIGLHMIDTIQWLLGPIDRLSCISKRQALSVEIEDTTAALFELENGVTGTLGTLFATPLNSYLRIYGTNGIAETKDDFATLSWTSGPSSSQENRIPEEDTLMAELHAFARACDGKIDYPVSPQEAIRNVAIIQAMEKSSRNNGQWINVNRQIETQTKFRMADYLPPIR